MQLLTYILTGLIVLLVIAEFIAIFSANFALVGIFIACSFVTYAILLIVLHEDGKTHQQTDCTNIFHSEEIDGTEKKEEPIAYESYSNYKKPKVFISYAWGSIEHDKRVLAFATSLVKDGIDTILDKWHMKEGNDTFSFMERSVNDATITNVLMLIDPIYAQKADEHTGGVGTETQIISAKVYQEVNQEKFIPIVFERDKHGNICKPTYLQGRLHFDLSVKNKYNDEYQRLVRTLYGVETYVKPKLGKKPIWVDHPKL